MSYVIKFGVLKGKTPEEAYNEGKVDELVKLKGVLLANFNSPKYDQYKKTNLEGYLAIEEVLLSNYQPKLKEFNELYCSLDVETKREIQNTINNDIFYNQDIIKLDELISSIKLKKK